MPSPLLSRWLRPRPVYYATLVIGLVVLLVLGRDQWFFGDDWVSLAPRQDPNIMVPQGGHWKLATALAFQLLRNWIGLGSYLPFLLLALLAHLAVAHLVWRILNRVGVAPWIATGLGLVVVFLGGGAENIFWAFQFGFMGAVALGLLVALLLDRQRLNIPLIVVAAIIAPTFSGTAIPVLAAAAIVGWIRHGFLKTLLLLAPAGVIYIWWYLSYALNRPGTQEGIHSLPDVAFALLYAAAMLGGGLGRALPWIGLGVIPAVFVVVWFVRGVRKGIRSPAMLAFALTIGAAVFAVLTSTSRISFGLTSAATPRYAYVVIVLLLPAFGLMLTSLAVAGPRRRVIAGLVVVGVLVTNIVLLALDASTQARREQGSRARVLDSLDAVISDPTNDTLLESPADPQWAPDLLGSDLLVLYRDGQLTPR
ncbi:hypothetical protein BH11ACT4_BH11ACT4_01920 [soil metagenome]